MTQYKNIEIAQRLLAGIGEGQAPETLAALFAEKVHFQIQGDRGVLPWIGHKNRPAGRRGLFRELRTQTEPVKFAVEDILGSTDRAAIVGELATRIKSSGKVFNTQFCIVLTISGDEITRFQMLEDSFELSRAVRA